MSLKFFKKLIVSIKTQTFSEKTVWKRIFLNFEAKSSLKQTRFFKNSRNFCRLLNFQFKLVKTEKLTWTEIANNLLWSIQIPIFNVINCHLSRNYQVSFLAIENCSISVYSLLKTLFRVVNYRENSSAIQIPSNPGTTSSTDSYHELSNKQRSTPERRQCSWRCTDSVHRRFALPLVAPSYRRRQCEFYKRRSTKGKGLNSLFYRRIHSTSSKITNSRDSDKKSLLI